MPNSSIPALVPANHPASIWQRFSRLRSVKGAIGIFLTFWSVISAISNLDFIVTKWGWLMKTSGPSIARAWIYLQQPPGSFIPTVLGVLWLSWLLQRKTSEPTQAVAVLERIVQPITPLVVSAPSASPNSAKLQAFVRTLTEYRRAMLELADEVTQSSVTNPVGKILARCVKLDLPVIHTLVHDGDFLPKSRDGRYKGPHPALKFKRPIAWHDTQLDAWKTIMSKVFHIDDFIVETNVLMGNPRPNANDVEEQRAREMRTVRLRAAMNRLSRATLEENQFLDIFCVETISMHPDDATTWMPVGVHSAGQRLVWDGFVDETEGETMRLTYRLEDSAVDAWQESEHVPDLRRREVVLLANAIQGSQGSGGGAPGSTGYYR